MAGVFKGVIEGITFPFIMLGMLAELAVRGLAWLSAGMAEVLGVARESTTDIEKDGESKGDRASADEAFDWTVTEALFDEVNAESRRAQGLDREAEDKKSESTNESHPSPLGFLVDFFRGLESTIEDLATSAGEKVAEKMHELLNKDDFSLGEGLGYVTGMIIFEVVLAIVTGGTWAAVRTASVPLNALLRIIRAGDQITRAMLGTVVAMGRPIMKGFGAAAGLLGRIPGVSSIVRRAREGLRKLFRSGDNAPKPKGAAAFTDPKERAIAEHLERLGRKVEPNLMEGVPGAGRQADAIVDGVRHEFKSLDPGATSATVRNSVDKSVSGIGQAREIVMDVRETGLSLKEARRGAGRALGISREKLDGLTLLGDDYFFRWTPR